MFERQLREAERYLLGVIRDLDLPLPQDFSWSPIPFQGRWGFGAPIAFQIAAAEVRAGLKSKVPDRAVQVAESIVDSAETPPAFSTIEAARGYVNLYMDPALYAGLVLGTVGEQRDDFGKGEPKSDIAMVEYAQPNTHHSFHIGHARAALLGESVARILELAGYETIRASYPGDIGLGVIKCMWAYRRFHEGDEPQGVHERGQWLADIYTEATSLLEPSPDENSQDQVVRRGYEAEVREMHRAWDAGDPEVRRLWQMTRRWSLDEFEAILSLLGIEMDVFFYESQVDELAKEITEELIREGLAEDEREAGGPVIVRIDEKLGLEKEQFRTSVLLRSDGTVLYPARDLALAKVKFEDYKVDRSIYVVDVRQSLHFQQVFKIMELMGFPQAEKCLHIPFGFVSLPEGAMSSRHGNVVLFMDVFEEANRRVSEIIQKKNPTLDSETAASVAEQVGSGALAYEMLSVDNRRAIVFDWNRALDFEGQAAPYIQYAHVRASSILRKEAPPKEIQLEGYEFSGEEVNLLEVISRFPDEVQRAARDFKPLVIANYAYELARAFTDFYGSSPVLSAEAPTRGVRLRMVSAARSTLANSLRLLTIQSPSVM